MEDNHVNFNFQVKWVGFSYWDITKNIAATK